MLTTVLASLFLFSGLTFGEYYNSDYGYDDYTYDDYEYRFDNAVYHLDRYHGPVYYFRHDRADVYFVLVGDITFVVPAYMFRPYLHRHNFVWVPRTRFISLSCCGLDYYDNHLRFTFYFDFYNRSKWSRGHHHRLRRDFRSYYKGRKHHKWYHKNRRSVMQQRSHHSHKHERRYRGNERHRVDGYKKYKHYKHSGSRNYNYSNSSSKKHYNHRDRNNSNLPSMKQYKNRSYKSSKPSLKKYSKRSDNYKSHVKSRNHKKHNSTYSYHKKIKRRNEKR